MKTLHIKTRPTPFQHKQHLPPDLLGAFGVFGGFEGRIVEGFGVIEGQRDSEIAALYEWAALVRLCADHDGGKLCVRIGRRVIFFGKSAVGWCVGLPLDIVVGIVGVGIFCVDVEADMLQRINGTDIERRRFCTARKGVNIR